MASVVRAGLKWIPKTALVVGERIKWDGDAFYGSTQTEEGLDGKLMAEFVTAVLDKNVVSATDILARKGKGVIMNILNGTRVDNHNNTLLHYVAAGINNAGQVVPAGQVEMLNFLLQSGADKKIQNSSDQSCTNIILSPAVQAILSPRVALRLS